MNWAETFLTKVIQAARMAYRLRDGLSVLLSDPKATTVADDIADTLADALFYFCGEQLRPDQDFILDSQTMKLIRSGRDDPETARAFLALMNPAQPAPQTLEAEEFQALHRKYGGYQAGREAK